ncbi:hypothetical protein NST62_05485 [Ureibacillus sp. FSL K6-8385]|uniref:Type II secretion system protein n=1 Tax=Ureibacillus terrenus TaxID=118246 RepID=A0A540V685_9BACL|nr:hypothetical protein [Ureibacillus terrenus]MED3660742.1 hypothetical protein [Ureibacillus terrenus]MED3762929.1 hypothetical protein [Ureibacillus terrenus]TQE92269.1 hypothetical protein FKZ59_00755 [Ureibacillus terrenus]
MWNEKGVSMIESMLTVSVIFVLVSFIPAVFQLKSSLHNQMLELHASQAAYEGVRIAKTTGNTEGRIWIDDVEYTWHLQNDTICVQYNHLDEERLKCVNADGESKTIKKALH